MQSLLDVVDNYTIYFRAVAGCLEAPLGRRIIDGSNRSYCLLDLEEDVTYNITIVAMNSINSLLKTTSFTTLTASKL